MLTNVGSNCLSLPRTFAPFPLLAHLVCACVPLWVPGKQNFRCGFAADLASGFPVPSIRDTNTNSKAWSILIKQTRATNSNSHLTKQRCHTTIITTHTWSTHPHMCASLRTDTIALLLRHALLPGRRVLHPATALLTGTMVMEYRACWVLWWTMLQLSSTRSTSWPTTEELRSSCSVTD